MEAVLTQRYVLHILNEFGIFFVASIALNFLRITFFKINLKQLF